MIEVWQNRDHFSRHDKDLLAAARARTPPPLAADAVREPVVEHLLQPRERRPTSDRLDVGGDRDDNGAAPEARPHNNRKEE